MSGLLPLPAAVDTIFRAHLAGLREACAAAAVDISAIESATGDELARVLAGSDYVAGVAIGRPELFAALIAGGDLHREYAVGEMRLRALAAVADCVDDETLQAALRVLRHREMVRIIWRDLCGFATLAQTTGDLTALADACIAVALKFLTAKAELALGVPTGETSQTPQKLVVIGMGKLGGGDLNLSSDVDLVFAYPEEGETRGAARALSNHEFFVRLGQRLIKVLDANTADGFVFRVDMRLRPWGNSGALACGFDAMESYYESQGRPWERYALIKARVCAVGDVEDLSVGERALQRLKPFVYRRYVDFSAFEALRELKGMIAREVQRKGMENDVKLGPGGIREIEFIAQAFQLIRGGVDVRLQQRGLLPVLAVLAETGLITAATRDELVAANDFLRRTEHRLQALDDRQTQRLPDDETARLRVAYAMDFSDWPTFMSALDAHRSRVEKHFRDVISVPGVDDAKTDAQDEWLDVWLGRVRPVLKSTDASAAAETAAENLAKALEGFRTDRAVVQMQAVARERLDKLMPRFLRVWNDAGAAPDVPERVLKILHAVLRRSAYLLMLVENPAALVELVKLCGASAWIAEEIARHPSLLDELLNAGTLYAPPKIAELRADLQAQLARVPHDDIEQQMEVLRHFRLAHVLKVAASDVMGTLPLMKVSDYLTWIAEAVLGEVLAIAWRDVTSKHGCPRDANGSPLGSIVEPRAFAIVAYGKLGGLELSYGSDLDLVFLYDAPADASTDGVREIANEAFFTRLVQRIINVLTTRTFSGELYEIDMRLRPSGASGLLVSSVRAFDRYQRESAWTWEHQALVRARTVAGDAAVGERLDAIRLATLSRLREEATLRDEVAAMRGKMVAHLGLAADTHLSAAEKAALFDVKHDPGGIVDIEFLVQYFVLRWTCEHPELAGYTDNVRQLDAIAAAGLLPPEDAALLRDAYLAFRASTHRFALGAPAKAKTRVDASRYAFERDGVQRLWKQVFGDAGADGAINKSN